MSKVAIIGAKERNTFSIGLLIALSSWTLIFFTLLWGYVVYRMRSTIWLGEIITPEIFYLSLINTGLLVVSSRLLSVAMSQKTKLCDRLSWAAVSFGAMFLIGQAKLWQIFLANGLNWKSSIAGGFFFLLTGFHAIHVVGGLVAILVLSVRFSSIVNSLFAQGSKLFWDFLLVVWLIMFLLIFVVK